VNARYRWFVVAILFAFMLLHQADKLLIGPLTTPIIETFGITKSQMGAVFTGALVVGAILYPIWGYLYDRYARPRLLALASLIWGSTTWLSAVVPTYPLFVATRASTGVDDSSYPGLYALISDYFGPEVRGKIYGLLQLTAPTGYLLGMVLALTLRGVVGWRGVFLITGSLGILLSAIIFFAVRERPRGSSEPELVGVEGMGIHRFEWDTALGLFRKPSLRLLFAQGFFGVFPWNVITYWFFHYLETERNYSADAVLLTMSVAVVMLAAGYPIRGALGDALFKRTRRGRLIVSTVGVLLGALFLFITLNVPLGNQARFLGLLSVTAIFVPFASANVIATVYDVTLPEVRSSALAVQYFIESAGAALAPWLAGIVADRASLQFAILAICISTWVICALFFAVAAYLVPGDIETLRRQLRRRAERLQSA
jgi:MFS family permease